MVKEISNIVDSALPMISIASFTASAFMGRKYGLAASYDISSRIAGFFGKQNVAEEYSKISSEYWKQAKQNGIRDLTAATGFIILGLASLAGKAFTKEEPKEPGWLDNIPIIRSIDKKIIIGGIGTVLAINWIKKPIFFCIREKVLNQMLSTGIKQPANESLFQDINKMMNCEDCRKHNSAQNKELFETYLNLRNQRVGNQNG